MDTLNITQRINSVNESLFDDLNKFYTAKDFEDIIYNLEMLEDSANRSRIPVVRNKLYERLDDLGVEYEKGQSSVYYKTLIEGLNLDDLGDIEKKLMDVIYDKFSFFPGPSDFMRRLVKSLRNSDDGWDECSIRLQILKRFIKYGNYLLDVGYGGKGEIRKYVREKAGLSSLPDKKVVTDSLDEGIFDILGECERECAPLLLVAEPLQRELETLESQKKSGEARSSELRDKIDVNKDEINTKKSKNHELSAEIAVISEKINRLEEDKIREEENMEDNPEKRNFYRGKYDRCCRELSECWNKIREREQLTESNNKDISRMETEIKAAKSEIEELKEKIASYNADINEKKAELKPHQDRIKEIRRSYDERLKWDGTYGLIKLADDLANGYFREGGSTKKALYYFAMVYDMTYNVDRDGIGTSAAEDDRIQGGFTADIEKDLFGDYYANNLTRYYMDAYKENSAAFEKEPNDQGINYKNYMEIVLLYYISKGNMSASDKLSESASKLQEIKNKVSELPIEKIEVEANTKTFRTVMINEVLEKTPEELVDFICKNYDYDIRVRNAEGDPIVVKTRGGEQYVNSAPMAAAASQTTAFGIYEDLKRRYYDSFDRCECDEDSSAENPAKYGLWLDIDSYERRQKNQAAGDPEKMLRLENLVCVLKGFNKFVKDCAFAVEKKENMSRTALVTAFYYSYNAAHENDRHIGENGEYIRIPFTEFFQNYKNEIDKSLNAAYYQSFSGKSIFDILLAFSSYTYLYY